MVDISNRYAFWSGQTEQFLVNDNAKTGKKSKWRWREWTAGKVIMFEADDVQFFHDMIEVNGSKSKASSIMRVFRGYLANCDEGDNWDDAFHSGDDGMVFMGVPVRDGEPDFVRGIEI